MRPKAGHQPPCLSTGVGSCRSLLLVLALVAWVLPGSGDAQSTLPPPSPEPSEPAQPLTAAWAASMSTGYLVVVFGVAFGLVTVTFIISWAMRCFYRRHHLRHIGEVEDSGSRTDAVGDGEQGAAPRQPSLPPVIVVNPGCEVSCASLEGESLRLALQQLSAKQRSADTLGSGRSNTSRLLQVVVKEDDGEREDVAAGGLPLDGAQLQQQGLAATQQAQQQAWGSRRGLAGAWAWFTGWRSAGGADATPPAVRSDSANVAELGELPIPLGGEHGEQQQPPPRLGDAATPPPASLETAAPDTAMARRAVAAWLRRQDWHLPHINNRGGGNNNGVQEDQQQPQQQPPERLPTARSAAVARPAAAEGVEMQSAATAVAAAVAATASADHGRSPRSSVDAGDSRSPMSSGSAGGVVANSLSPSAAARGVVSRSSSVAAAAQRQTPPQRGAGDGAEAMEEVDIR